MSTFDFEGENKGTFVATSSTPMLGATGFRMQPIPPPPFTRWDGKTVTITLSDGSKVLVSWKDGESAYVDWRDEHGDHAPSPLLRSVTDERGMGVKFNARGED